MSRARRRAITASVRRVLASSSPLAWGSTSLPTNPSSQDLEEPGSLASFTTERACAAADPPTAARLHLTTARGRSRARFSVAPQNELTMAVLFALTVKGG